MAIVVCIVLVNYNALACIYHDFEFFRFESDSYLFYQDSVFYDITNKNYLEWSEP